MNFPGMTGIGAAATSPKFGGPGLAAGAGTGPGGTDPNDPTVKMVQGAMESCYVKTVMSGVVGFGLGGVFGLFMASMAYDTPYHTAIPTPDAPATAAATAAKGAPGAATSAAATSTATSTTASTAASTAASTTAPTAPTASTIATTAKPGLSVPVPKVAPAAASVTSAGAGTVTQSAILNPTYAALSSLPLREQLRQGFRDMGSRSWSTAKNFGTVGALFSGIECGIEGLRAKNDIANGVAAGCLTGAILARNAGPQAAAVGCAGFAAFSAAIDAYMRMPPTDD